MKLVLKPLIGVVLNALALYGLVYFVPGITYSGGITLFIVGGIVLEILNTLVKPLAKILSFPFIILTGGLFLIAINAGFLWLLSYILEVAKFRDAFIFFPTFGTYVIGAIIFGALNWVLGLIIKN